MTAGRIEKIGDASLILGDCLLELPKLAAAGERFHACVTDPPYEIGFMSRKWDNTGIASRPETWRAVYDCLLPGAYLLAFGGTRTFHRMVCAIEDAGFEIKDTIMWIFASGFPKSHNVDKALRDDQRCLCHRNGVSYRNEKERSPDSQDVPAMRRGLDSDDAISGGAEQDVFSGVRRGVDIPAEGGETSRRSNDPMCGMRECVSPAAVASSASQSAGVLLPVQRRSARGRLGQARGEGVEGSNTGRASKGDRQDDGAVEPVMDGWSDLQETEGELQRRPLGSVPSGLADHENGERLYHGAQAGNGSLGGTPPDPIGSGSPCGSRPMEQRPPQLRTLAEQSESQAGGAWHLCGRCGKPRIPAGIGSALKPAYEPIIVARKPLDGTIAGNVLKHGCGAINIDGCRVGSESRPVMVRTDTEVAAACMSGKSTGATASGEMTTDGRWPANVCTDGSAEVLAAFPDAPGQLAFVGQKHGKRDSVNCYGDYGARPDTAPRIEANKSAARFFYTAKADKEDRNGGKHPTVKPRDLMRWLVRLVTPPGGTVLDPFAGSGSTLQAALAEGLKAVGIEREAEYFEDALRRLQRVSGADAPLFVAPPREPAPTQPALFGGADGF